MDPKIVQTILADDQLQTLKQILKLQESMVPQGEVVGQGTGESVVGEKYIPFTKPYFSVQIVNDGPSEVDIGVNHKLRNMHRMKVGETYKIDMPVAKIFGIYVKVSGTGAATVRYPGYY